MRGRGGPGLRAACAMLVVAGALPPQAATFDEGWRAISAAPEQERPPLAAAALAAFLRLEAADPARRARLEQAGAVAVMAGNPGLAIELLAELGDACGQLGCEWRLRALLRLERGAAAAVRVAADPWPAVAAALRAEEGSALRAAERLLRGGAEAAGVALFEGLARAWPDDAIRLANLALTRRHLGRIAAAETAYQRALALAPTDGQIWNDLGLLLRAAGRPADAVAAFRRSLELDARAGEGPAVTNLVQMEVLHPGSTGGDPMPVACAALAIRPDAVMLRRVTLDLILARAQPPDTAATNR